MRILLEVSDSFKSQLPLASSSAGQPPLVFIDSEPFIVELQGRLELPEGETEDDGLGNVGTADDAGRLRGSRVGKIDLSDPKKPTMRIAHHRLEGKLETLLTPYALLRTSKRARLLGTTDGISEREEDFERANKRARTEGTGPEGEPSSGNTRLQQDTRGEDNGDAEGSTTRIEIVGIIRKKIVFNKRPEPLIEISSEADPTANLEGRKDKEAKRGPKGLLGFGGAKR